MVFFLLTLCLEKEALLYSLLRTKSPQVAGTLVRMRSETYTEDNLREKVFQKHPENNDVLICYCFEYKSGAIKQDFRDNGYSEIFSRIREGTKKGKCSCDTRNPQGSCCLGNVESLLKLIDR